MIEIHLHMNNYHNAELELIATFKRQFIHRHDIGAEYFEGDLNKMIDLIYSYYVQQRKIAPDPVPVVVNERKQDDELVFLLELAFNHVSQFLREIISDKYYLPEMEGVFLEHMVFLITGRPGGYLHDNNNQLPISHDQPAPIMNFDKFRTALGVMYAPGSKKGVTCDQYRRYADIHNFLIKVHPLVVQYEAARKATTRPARYPEIKTSGALKISQDIFNANVQKCIDYKRIATITAGQSNRRRARQ